MRNMITSLAKWWLKRHAYVVIYGPTFMGIAVGNCHVAKKGPFYEVLPRDPDPYWIALNHSVIVLDEPKAAA